MSNFLDALSSAARSGACALLGVPNYVNDALDRTGFFPFTEARRAIPDFWRNALCDTPAPNPNPPAFTGGQCEGVLYRVNWVANFTVNSTGQFVPQSGQFLNVLGPVNQFRTSIGSQTLVEITSPDGIIRRTAGVNEASNTINQIGITTVTRMDNQPDTCGDPDPDYEDLEPGDVTINQDITYNNSAGVSITIPVVLVYARANIDATANITIPFTANINGELEVTGNVNLDGTVNINIGSAGGGDAPKDPRKSPCDDIALPDGEVDEDPTDSDQPPQPDRDAEKVIKGVLVTVTALSNERASTIVQDENPDIYVPSLGHVQFLCRVGETSAAWTSDIPVKNRRNLIQCPWDWGAIDVRGTPQPGVTWQLTPIVGYVGQPVEYVT